MNLVLILSVLAQSYVVNTAHNIHSFAEGWWGNIHHLSQLIMLAKLEELKLVPAFSGIKHQLRVQRRQIEHNIYCFRNLSPVFHCRKPKSLKFRFKLKTVAIPRTRIYDILIHNNEFGTTLTRVTSRDLFMSVNSLLHIHQLYGIKLTSGYQQDTIQGGFLNTICNLIIGAVSLSRGMYYRAIEWMEPELQSKMIDEDQNFTHLQASLCYIAIQEHNRVHSKTKSNKFTSNKLYQIYTNLYSEPVQYPSSQMATTSIKYPPKLADLFGRNSLQSKFTDLCQGNTIQTPQTQKALKCYHDQHKHPYFYLKPIKVEQLSKNPPILQFYDVLGNKIINYLKAFKEVLINPKMLYGDQSKYLGFEDVATYARRNMLNLVYKNYPQLGVMSEFLTGLKISNLPGPLLWAEYIYGRMVGVHEDTAGEPNNFDGLVTLLNKGEMIAALMFYIDTPDKGGQTPYLQAGVKAEAVKGSAVFWMTSYRNGSRRRDVHHAGCPILHGNKIVMITPIWYNANWNQHTCLLNRFK